MNEMRIRHTPNGFICSYDLFDEKEDEEYTEEMLFEHARNSGEGKARALQRAIVAMTRYFGIVDEKQYNDMKRRLEVFDYGTVEEDTAESESKAGRKGKARQDKGRGPRRGHEGA